MINISPSTLVIEIYSRFKFPFSMKLKYQRGQNLLFRFRQMRGGTVSNLMIGKFENSYKFLSMANSQT